MRSKSNAHTVNWPETECAQDIAAVLAYLHVCLKRRDWHGVSDAACDIRVLEAKLELLVRHGD